MPNSAIIFRHPDIGEMYIDKNSQAYVYWERNRNAMDLVKYLKDLMAKNKGA